MSAAAKFWMAYLATGVPVGHHHRGYLPLTEHGGVMNISLPIPSDPMADHFMAVRSPGPEVDLHEAQRLAEKAWCNDDPNDPECACPPHLQLETDKRRFVALYIHDYLYGTRA